MEQEIISLVEKLEEFQQEAARRFKLDDKGVSFQHKKEVTSALRRLAPIGLSTGILWTTNLRTLRFVLGKRTEEAAEEEMRLVFDLVGQRITKEYPTLFGDFARLENGVWTSPHAKI
jgi:thymidylate synthase (FAD)